MVVGQRSDDLGWWRYPRIRALVTGYSWKHVSFPGGGPSVDAAAAFPPLSGSRPLAPRYRLHSSLPSLAQVRPHCRVR